MQTDTNTSIAPLRDLPDFKVAEGSPDVRGWDVKASDGQKVGEVHELMVDKTAGRVRYLDVEVDKTVAGSKGQHVLIPIGAAQLGKSDEQVTVNGIASSQIGALPPYTRQALTRDYETQVLQVFGTSRPTGPAAQGRDFYTAEQFDDSQFYGGRQSAGAMPMSTGKAGRDDEKKLTLSEEELRVGKREASAGEVGVRKTVDTEHVQKTVPVSREEVTIERRPIEAGAAAGADIGEDEIRIPLTQEELVAEKRVVGKEEIVIKKQTVTEDQTVEADVRKERVDIDDQANRSSRQGTKQTSDPKRGGESLGDKIARGVDNLKDRVDGDPASKPGSDPTDRRR